MTRCCPNTKCPDGELFGVRGESTDATHCPKCGTRLEDVQPSPKHQPAARIGSNTRRAPHSPRTIVPLIAPRSSAELAVISSVLRAEGIFFFVHNERFGSLIVGPVIPLHNERTICVHPENLERAAEALQVTSVGKAESGGRYTRRDRLRVLLEGLLFGWFVPNARHPYSRARRD